MAKSKMQQMDIIESITHQDLPLNDSIKYGFFTRNGGSSKNEFASLNCSYSKNDDHEIVSDNRQKALNHLGLEHNKLLTLSQKHTSDVVVIEDQKQIWKFGDAPIGDALVTNQKNLVIGVLTADCSPILLMDEKNSVIGAIHAGWRGAGAQIIENSVAKMLSLGADLAQIKAVIGPTIAQKSYEVSEEFRDNFIQISYNNENLFVRSAKIGHFHFDLPGYVAKKLKNSGIKQIFDLELDTCSLEDRFFSCRRSFLNGVKIFGNNLSIICIK